jgi:hypothetical protein
MAKRYTLESFDLKDGDPTTPFARGVAGLFSDSSGHCDVVFDKDIGKWKAISDIGNVAVDEWQVAAALRCLAARFGVPL